MLAIILVSVFLALMVFIGVIGMKKTTTLGDFFLGGRNIGPWVSAFAYGTTYFSAVLFIGFAGKLGWGFGLNVLWISLGNAAIGALLAWLVLGRRTRRMTQNLDVMTMPEFLQERYGAKSFKLIAAIIIFIFLLPYSGSVFKGLGHLFEVNFNMSYDIALLIMIGITGLYLILGGYFAITLTDFIQGLIMIVGSFLMVGVLVGKQGGLVQTVSGITSNFAAHMPGKSIDVLMLISLVFMTSFGTWGLPQMVQKFYAIKDEKMILRGAIITTVFSIIIVFAAYFTGAMTHLFFDRPPVENGVVMFDKMIPDMLKAQLPEMLMAVILLLVLSASMSTLSSLVLVSASAIAIDMYKGHINPKISKKNSVTMMRVLSGLFVILSFFIAKLKLAIIVTLMSLSWGSVAGSFMAAYFYGLFWKRTTKTGAFAGMLTGLTLSIVLFFVMGPARSPIVATISMIVPFAVIPLVSLITEAPNAKLINKAFKGI